MCKHLFSTRLESTSSSANIIQRKWMNKKERISLHDSCKLFMITVIRIMTIALNTKMEMDRARTQFLTSPRFFPSIHSMLEVKRTFDSLAIPCFWVVVLSSRNFFFGFNILCIPIRWKSENVIDSQCNLYALTNASNMSLEKRMHFNRFEYPFNCSYSAGDFNGNEVRNWIELAYCLGGVNS